MAKTLTQILTDAREIIAQPDSSNSQFTDPQLTIWVNDAYRRIVVELRHLPIKTRDYSVSSASITLNSGTVTVDLAKMKNPNSGEYEELEIIKLDEMIKIDPDWESADSNIPTKLVRTGTFTAILYPPPNAATIAQTTPLRTYGLELPTELSAGGDTPDIPGNFHDIISHWVAFRCFEFLNREAEATQQITLFRGMLKEQKQTGREFSRHLKRWRFEERQSSRDW